MAAEESGASFADFAKRECTVSAPPSPSTDFVRMNAKGKGKGGKAGGYPSRPNPGVTCKCCGGAGHFRGDCRHQGKAFNKCGKTGHLEAVCRNGAAKEETTPDQENAKRANNG